MPGQRWAFTAIGTTWCIETERALDAELVAAIRARAEAFDATFSRFRPDSMIMAMSRDPGRFTFPEEAAALLALYRELYDATEGAVTPLIGQVLEHLGLDPAYSLRPRPGRAPVVPEWDEVMQVDGAVIVTARPVIIDLGAAGKGFLVDLLADLLRGAGIVDFVIDASGDLLHRGVGVERVGLEDPVRAGHLIGLVEVSNGAMCASSVSRRAWGDGLHHVIDPATRAPVDGVVATWVTSTSCALADGLATALFLTDPDDLRRRFDFAYARLWSDRHADYSDNLNGEIFV